MKVEIIARRHGHTSDGIPRIRWAVIVDGRVIAVKPLVAEARDIASALARVAAG